MTWPSRPNVSVGELLDHKVGTGVAKRGFGPRGFPAHHPRVRRPDRILMLEDGIRTGSLASQSGDHGELINPAQLERLEIVKGPATLLYSGSLHGRHGQRHQPPPHRVRNHPHEGVRGFVSGSAGTTDALGGVNAAVEYGVGQWLFWGPGRRTPHRRLHGAPGKGEIFNSRSRMTNGGGGFGYYGEKMFFSMETRFDNGTYGVPFVQDYHAHLGEEEDEHPRRRGRPPRGKTSTGTRRSNASRSTPSAAPTASTGG